MNEFDAKRFRVANPDALGEKEKELWVKLEPMVQEVLDELKTAGKIESVFVQAEMDLLTITLHKLDEFSLVHNVLINLFDSPSKSKKFLAANTEFGLSEANTISAYLMAATTMAALSTELFKLM